MHSRVNTQRALCGLMALAIFSSTLGCNAGNSSDQGARRNYRILTHVKKQPLSTSEYRERSGSYSIAFEDNKAQDVSYYVRNYLARGKGDVEIGMSDPTGDSAYWIDDENSTVTIESQGGVEQFIVNPDESVIAGGMWFPDGEAAAAYLATTSTVGAVSDVSIAGAHDQVSTEMGGYDDSSRGTAVVYIVAVTWVVTSALLCRREFKRVNYDRTRLSQYCAGWCQSRPCR